MQKLPVNEVEPILCCIDMGTTRMRGWVTEGSFVWSCAAVNVGARDVAAGRSRAWLSDQLRMLVKSLISEGLKHGLSKRPAAALAAGMITSKQGLVDVPHLEAPVGIAELARNLYAEDLLLTGGDSLPLFLVPGVRSGFDIEGLAATFDADLMRGEETLCVGLLEQEKLSEQTLLLNLGSHWKLIWVDSQRRIAGSRTSVSGETIHAIQSHTLLASSLPQHPPEVLHAEWVQLGYDEAARSGLSRALFCTRLLDLRKFGTGDQRLSFLYGCILQGEMDHLAALRGEQSGRLLIAGSAPVAETCAKLAERLGMAADILSQGDREEAYLLGLRMLHHAHTLGMAGTCASLSNPPSI